MDRAQEHEHLRALIDAEAVSAGVAGEQDGVLCVPAYKFQMWSIDLDEFKVSCRWATHAAIDRLHALKIGFCQWVPVRDLDGNGMTGRGYTPRGATGEPRMPRMS